MSPLAAKPAPASISAEPGTSQAGGRSTASPSEVHTGVHTRVSTKPHAATVLPAGVQPSPARTAEVRHGTVADQDPRPQVPDQGSAGLPPLPCRPRTPSMARAVALRSPCTDGGRSPLVAQWGGISLARDTTPRPSTTIPRASGATAGQNSSSGSWPTPCELCGSGNQVDFAPKMACRPFRSFAAEVDRCWLRLRRLVPSWSVS